MSFTKPDLKAGDPIDHADLETLLSQWNAFAAGGQVDGDHIREGALWREHIKDGAIREAPVQSKDYRYNGFVTISSPPPAFAALPNSDGTNRMMCGGYTFNGVNSAELMKVCLSYEYIIDSQTSNNPGPAIQDVEMHVAIGYNNSLAPLSSGTWTKLVERVHRNGFRDQRYHGSNAILWPFSVAVDTPVDALHFGIFIWDPLDQGEVRIGNIEFFAERMFR